MAELQCDHSHEHEVIEGTETEDAGLWPWGFAVAVANGITDYLADVANKTVASAFPGAAAAAPVDEHERYYGPDGQWAPALAAPAAAAPKADGARRRLQGKTSVAAKASSPSAKAMAKADPPAKAVATPRAKLKVIPEWKCPACNGRHVKHARVEGECRVATPGAPR